MYDMYVYTYSILLPIANNLRKSSFRIKFFNFIFTRIINVSKHFTLVIIYNGY